MTDNGFTVEGVEKDIATAMQGVDVFNHNLETVERMTPLVRSKAQYRRSLEVLSTAARLSGGTVPTELEQKAADVNGDGTVNGVDANVFAQFLAGAIGGF